VDSLNHQDAIIGLLDLAGGLRFESVAGGGNLARFQRTS